jgi:hypothetical protein
LAAGEECSGVSVDFLHEAPPKGDILRTQAQGADTGVGIPVQQLSLACLQFRPPRILSWETSQFALYPNEGGPVGLPMLVQPVGVDQARRVVVRGLDEGLEEGVVLCN